MGAARKNGPCISQGMAESMTRHYLHDGKKKKNHCHLQPAGLWLSDFDKVSHGGPSFHTGVAPRQPHCLYWHTAANTHKHKILRKHKILISQHTLDGKCVCWQGKKAGKSVWLGGYCLNGCSTANSPTESSSVSPSIKVSVWRSSLSPRNSLRGFHGRCQSV